MPLFYSIPESQLRVIFIKFSLLKECYAISNTLNLFDYKGDPQGRIENQF